MRAIKFRGKRMKDSKWVYGHFGKDYSERCIISNYLNASNEAWEVIPGTIGQFTGLLDKNGKDIYEGDILSFDFSINSERYLGSTPNFYHTKVSVEYDSLSFKGRNLMHWGKKHNSRNFQYYYLTDNKVSNMEVIGNIHDNPELLKGGSDE